jgi:hypothetical protein
MRRRITLLCAALSLSCEHPAAEPQPAVASEVIDSILPIGEAMRRFRSEHGATPRTSLQGGSTMRDELVRAFIRAVEENDTGALRAMVIDAAEFIALYYPISRYTREPYRQSPGFVWFQFEQHSQQGLTRVLDRFGGSSTGFAGYDCAAEPGRHGNTVLWENCRIRWRLHDRPVRLFGTIIEVDGNFKFVSYTNDF